MRSRGVLAVIVLATGFGLLPGSASARGLYLALGDSVTQGPGAVAGGGFVERYFRYLRAPGHGGLDRLSNLARSGETSTTMRRPGGQLARAVAAVEGPSDTRVVTLDIGGNDSVTAECSHGWTAYRCPFRANYTEIVRRLAGALANDPGAETFQVMEYYNPASGTGSSAEANYDLGLLGDDLRIDCSAGDSGLGLNDLLACIGRDAGAEPVDTYPTFKAGGQPLLTGIHPSTAGHRYIACLFEHPERAGSPRPCPPLLTLSVRRRQRVLVHHGLVLFARVDQAAQVTASATIGIPRQGWSVRLGPGTVALAPGRRARIVLGLSRRGRRIVRRTLRSQGKLVASVRACARGAAYSSPTAARRVALVP